MTLLTTGYDYQSSFTCENLSRNQNIGNAIPRVIMLDHLGISVLTKRPKPMDSTRTYIYIYIYISNFMENLVLKNKYDNSRK